MGLILFGPAIKPAGSQDPVALPVSLYFADPTHSHLSAEVQQMVKPADPSQFGRQIINTLIQGPQQGLMRTIPEGTTLRAIFITEEKTAYLDFEKTIFSAHPGGALLEMLMIYSITNSLILNIPAIDEVKFLIDGQEPTSLSGHLNLKYPFKANMLLIR
jgi:spore germination protein GerM